MSKRKVKADLSKLELEVMDVIWDLGDCSSAEVIAAFSAEKRSLAPTTIRTVLANLRKKGYVKTLPTKERGFRMRPTVERDEVARSTLSGLVAHLFGGSPGQAILHLLEDKDIDEEELSRIRDLVESKREGAK